MKWTVIGYYGGSLKAGKAASGYLLEAKEPILIDCGSGIVSTLQQRIDLNQINHVVLSHYHWDHFSDLGALIYHRVIQQELGMTQQPLHLYGQVIEPYYELLSQYDCVEFHPIESGQPFEVVGVQFTPAFTHHPVPCLAFSIQDSDHKIFYGADGEYAQELIPLAQDSDLLVIEASLYPEISGEASGHMNALDAAQFIVETAPKQAILTHLPIYGDPEEILKVVLERTAIPVHLAESWFTVDLK